MKQTLKKFFKRLINISGYQLISSSSLKSDPVIQDEYGDIQNKIESHFSMRKNTFDYPSMYSVFNMTRYISRKKIKGDIIELGVFQGAKIGVALMTLNLFKDFSRDIYLYDTFEGLSEPHELDFQMINQSKPNKGSSCASLEEVKDLIYSLDVYPKEKIKFIKGNVLETLKDHQHNQISLLRLDLDLYEPLLYSMRRLYQFVVNHGVIIHDDYGHWNGHLHACNQFYKELNINPLLIRTSRKERTEIKNH